MRKLHNKKKIDQSDLLRKGQQVNRKGNVFWNANEDIKLRTRIEIYVNIVRKKYCETPLMRFLHDFCMNKVYLSVLKICCFVIKLSNVLGR